MNRYAILWTGSFPLPVGQPREDTQLTAPNRPLHASNNSFLADDNRRSDTIVSRPTLPTQQQQQIREASADLTFHRPVLAVY